MLRASEGLGLGELCSFKGVGFEAGTLKIAAVNASHYGL